MTGVTARPRVREGVWRLADPKISLASLSAIALGTTAAARDGALALGWLAVTVVGVFAIEVAKNASGEVFDFDSGTDLAIAPGDRSPFSGGKRVLVEGLLTRAQTWTVAILGYALAAACGALIVLFREPSVLWLGMAGIACAFFYHAPPARLSYRGFGELTVALCYGPGIVGGTYLVQRGHLPTEIVLLAVPLGLLIGAFLWINEFPDYRSDRRSGKDTLVVQLGRETASRIFVGLVVASMAILALLPLVGHPVTVWIGAVSALPAASAAETVLAYPRNTAALVPAQTRTLLAFVTLAVGTGIGLLLPV